MMADQHVVALGSSFAAGPDIEPVVDRAAGRSGRNYASLLAERLGARLTDPSVSKATTASILDTPQRAGFRASFPPQIEGVPADADLELVRASRLGRDHALGAPDPWVTGFRPSPHPAPFHPNVVGMQAIADALHRLVG